VIVKQFKTELLVQVGRVNRKDIRLQAFTLFAGRNAGVRYEAVLSAVDVTNA